MLFLAEVTGAKLEAELYVNQGSNGGVGLVIVHPYPLLGGSMRDPVVSEIFRVAAASPAFAAVLRYNQRGVGRSTGGRSLQGRPDAQDLSSMCEFLCNQLNGANKRVAVVGYSWGACLAAATLSCPYMAAYVGVSFPLGGLALLLQPRKHFDRVCGAVHIPRLLVAGSQDQYINFKTMQRLVLQHGGTSYDSWTAARQRRMGGSGAGGGENVPAGQEQQQVEAGLGKVTSPEAAEPRAGAVQAALGQPSGFAPSTGSVAAPAAAPRQSVSAAPLLLRTYAGSDHFWLEERERMAEEVVQWLEGVLVSPA